MAAAKGLAPGTLVQGRYQVIRELGRGGFGAVYLATDARLGGRQVALKENTENTAAAEAQFKLEAQMLASLHHPNLPQVSDHFVDGGKQYLVMDFVAGDDLDAYVERAGRPATEHECVSWARQILSALVYLHGQSPPVIHRDLKPANVKVTPGGQVMLVDFGIAKYNVAGQVTAAGAKGYSPGYSPCEQYGGGRTDARSDIYSLGATLYAVLTLELPADAMGRLTANMALRPPRQLNPAIPVYLEQLVLRSMELPQGRRFQTAQEMLDALNAACPPAGGPPVSRPGAAAAPAGRPPVPVAGPLPARPTPLGGSAGSSPGYPPLAPMRPAPVLPVSSSGGPACPRCGLFNRPGASFCLQCGERLSGPGGAVARAPVVAGHISVLSHRAIALLAGGAAAGDLLGLLLQPLVGSDIGPLVFAVLATAGALAGAVLAERSRWRGRDTGWVLGLMGVCGLLPALLGGGVVRWGGYPGGVPLTFCLTAWLGAAGGGLAGAALTETGGFYRMLPWGLRPRVSPGAFPYERAASWVALGSAVGVLLAFLPHLFSPGGQGDAVAWLTTAGVAAWPVVGAVAGAAWARRADLGKDVTVYRLLASLAGALLCVLALGGIIAGAIALDRTIAVVLLVFLGTAGGSLLGAYAAGLDRVRRFVARLS